MLKKNFRDTKVYRLLRKSDILMDAHFGIHELLDNIRESKNPDSSYVYMKESSEYYGKRINYWNKVLMGTETDTIRLNLNSFNERKKNVSDKCVAMIVEHVSGRCLKIISALKKENFNIEIYYYKENVERNGVTEKLHIEADIWQEYSNVGQLMAEMIYSKAFVCHFFMEWSDCGNACVMLKNKEYFPPIVVEHYDVLNGMYSRRLHKHFARERYAFEHAAGVVFREFSGEYLENKMGFKMKNQLIFLDYYNKKNENAKAHSTEEETLSFVYVGGVVTEKQYPGASYACWLQLAEICKNNYCHLHIYPANYDTNTYADYIALEMTNEFFHFHKPLPFDQMIKQISEYDYGIFPNTKGIYERKNNGYNTPEKLIYASTNKYYDYLCAGLPIIAVSPFKLVESMKQGGFIIPWTIEEYNFKYLRENKQVLKRRVFENREKYAIDNRINELIDFYRKVSNVRS